MTVVWDGNDKNKETEDMRILLRMLRWSRDARAVAKGRAGRRIYNRGVSGLLRRLGRALYRRGR